MKRLSILTYGLGCYALSLATFAYSFAFLGNLWLSTSLDSARIAPVAGALLIDLALLALFGVQHTVMARRAFKRWWTRIVPAAAERSTYVLCSCVALLTVFVLWQPIGGVLWQVEAPLGRALLYGAYVLGWGLLLLSTFLINHFDLFGLRQVWLHWLGRPYQPAPFKTPLLYRYVRHPLYVGWLITFWAAPIMTVAHLLFAAATTLYILIAIQFEERDLAVAHPEYQEYRRRVPMLVPFLIRARQGTRHAESARPSG